MVFLWLAILARYIWNAPVSFHHFETTEIQGEAQRRTGRKHQGSRNPIAAPQLKHFGIAKDWWNMGEKKWITL